MIRIHPAEVLLRNHPTREGMADHIAAHDATLPPNVRIVEAEPNQLIRAHGRRRHRARVRIDCRSGAGGARRPGRPCRGHALSRRGFTIDVDDGAAYWTAVDRLVAVPPGRASRDQTRELARRYAFLFFFRFHHVLDAINEEGRSRPQIRVGKASDLDPGRDPVMDRVVTGIIQGIPPLAPPGNLDARVPVAG